MHECAPVDSTFQPSLWGKAIDGVRIGEAFSPGDLVIDVLGDLREPDVACTEDLVHDRYIEARPRIAYIGGIAIEPDMELIRRHHVGDVGEPCPHFIGRLVDREFAMGFVGIRHLRPSAGSVQRDRKSSLAETLGWQ